MLAEGVPVFSVEDRGAASELPPEAALRYVSRDDMLAELPDVLSGTDPVRHERDILFVVNYARENDGIQTMSSFAEWMTRQLLNAQRSKYVKPPSKFAAPEPDISVLARYLRDAQKYQPFLARRE